MTSTGDSRERPVAEPAPTQTAYRRIVNPFTVGVAVAGVLALVVRWVFISVVDPHVPAIGDASAYHLLANNLADGRGYIRPFDLLVVHKVHTTAEYPPLFPAVLSVVSWFGAKSVQAQRLCMGVVGAATVVVIER